MASAARAGLAMRMHIERVDLADAQTVRACHEGYLAAERVDEPDGPWMGERLFGGWLACGWGGYPSEAWLAREAGPVAGWYRMELPDLEDLHRAWLGLTVRPEARRRGTGRALLRHAAARAQADGRSVLAWETRGGTPGEPFSRSAGATPEFVDIQRVQDLGRLETSTLVALRESAERAAADYSLVSWTGLVPEELLEQVAQLFAALNDAPRSQDSEPGVWDARRVRERVNALRPRFGLREYSVAARHDASGELAALTQVAVDPADHGWGHQMITAVTRKHRGHRLGLLVKTAMLEALRISEPQIERIDTWNAEANRHMIAVNEALGYRIAGQPLTRWRLDVSRLAP